MGVYYKATRPDGFDFYSRTVDYAGHLANCEWLPVKDSTEPECCSDTVYHASTSKADTLIGGEWPCRLFEVEGDAVAEEENKRGFLTLRVVREIPAWEALGPNGEAAARLIEAAGRINSNRAFFRPESTGRAARNAACDAAGRAARNAALGAAGYAAWEAARNAAWDAAGYAAVACVAADLISPEDFEVLYGPWASVMGWDPDMEKFKINKISKEN